MTRGWFDAFRENGGPTLYSYSNRTAVTADVATLTLYIVFVTLFLAFVIIFPGVRRQRFTTFTSVTLSLFVGTAILGEFFTLSTNHNKHWHIFFRFIPLFSIPGLTLLKMFCSCLTSSPHDCCSGTARLSLAHCRG